MVLDRTTLIAKWNSLFPSNSNRLITALHLRDFVADIADSALNKADELYDEVKSLRPNITSIAGLKAVVTGDVSTGVNMIFRDAANGGILRVYELASGTTAESSPTVIRPNDYAATTNEKIWRLALLPVPTGTVQSVTGAGVNNTDPANPVISYPAPADIGLGNVNNTTDANKPVSIAQGIAITTAENNAKAYADSLVVGMWDDRGNWDASTGIYPNTGGSGPAGARLKGDTYTVSVVGTLPTGQVVELGDTLRALVDNPGNTQANWAIIQNNLGYVPITNVLASGLIIVGNSGGVATPMTMGGQASISNIGAVTLSNAAVIAKVLTGYAAAAGVVSAADSILSAIQKLDGNIGALPSAYWKTAGASTLTAAVSISGAIPNTLTFAGTYTALLNNQYYNSVEPTITLRATASDAFSVSRLKGSFIHGGNTQTLTLLEISSAVNINSTTGAIVQGIIYNPTITGTPATHTALGIATGRVGFGTLSPAAPLEVRVATSGEIIRCRWDLTVSTGQISFYNGAASIFDINVGGSGVPSGGAYRALLTTQNAAGYMEFRTAASVKAGIITPTQMWGFGAYTSPGTLPVSRMESIDSFAWGIDTRTANTTLSELYGTTLWDCASGNLTCTPPSASSALRRIYPIVKVDATANTLSITGLVGGTKVISAQGKGVWIQSNGTNWYIICEF